MDLVVFHLDVLMLVRVMGVLAPIARTLLVVRAILVFLTNVAHISLAMILFLACILRFGVTALPARRFCIVGVFRVNHLVAFQAKI